MKEIHYYATNVELKNFYEKYGIRIMECPNYNADFYYSGETKTEEGSYWIDEDEPFPF